MDIKEKLAESKVREAEAKIATQKIRRDAAYRRLVAAQRSGGSADTRARFAALYDRAEERLEEAENAAREAKRVAMGLSARVPRITRDMGATELNRRAEVVRLLRGKHLTELLEQDLRSIRKTVQQVGGRFDVDMIDALIEAGILVAPRMRAELAAEAG